VKTTIEIPDELAAATKRFAAEHGLSLRQVHERALQQLISGTPAGRGRFRLKTVITDGEGCAPGLDWASIRDRIHPVPGKSRKRG
jgi:hypothetical protein